MTVIVLERDRHEQLIEDLRAAGARVTLIRDGDVAPAIAAAHGGIATVDLLMGVGGTPEGVIAAARSSASAARSRAGSGRATTTRSSASSTRATTSTAC